MEEALASDSTGLPETVKAADFVTDLARQATLRLAPAEAAVFDEVAAAWRSGAASRRAPGGGVGFGIEETLVSAVILQVVSQCLAEVLGLGVGTVRSRWRRWRERRSAAIGPRLATVETPAIDGKIVVTAAQAARLREVARHHATVLGLPGPEAEVLADAMVGAVRVLGEPEPPGDDGA
ncbi:hypothetical protein [Micromonospora sp. NPDC051006]|uniref:hypothetical protein n=1 Tax=Micromonospora sp. NPDC051006 TaxID=3364283 RepID=UPI00378BA1D5